MKASALLPALLVLAGCAPSAEVTEGERRGYAYAAETPSPGQGCGARKAGEIWCAPCHVLSGGEPTFKENICESGRIRAHGPCTPEAICRAPTPTAATADAFLVLYDIQAPDQGCNRPGEGGRAVMLVNRGRDRPIIAQLQSAQGAVQTLTVPAAEQVRLGCVADQEQPTRWALQRAEWTR